MRRPRPAPRPRLAAVLTGVLAALAAPTAWAQDAHRLEDPLATTNRATWLVIAPEAFADALTPLLDRRGEDGQAAGLVTVESLEVALPAEKKRGPMIKKFLAHALGKFATPPRFVLLAADTDRIPCFRVDKIPTDHPYICPRDGKRMELAVGRFPARTAEGISHMVAKTLRLEERRPGLWQRDLAFFAGVGGFQFDRALEILAGRMLSAGIPVDYDIEMTYASPTSPYFYPPAQFADALRERVEGGPLMVTFIGHGSETGTQRVRFAGKSHPILDARTAARLEEGNPAGMLVLACSTGAYHREQDSIGEMLIKRPSGVTWFLGASLPSAPFGNGALGDELSTALLSPTGPDTVGEAVVAAKRSLLKNPLKRALGRISAAITGVSTAGDELREHVLMYNLLGDPGLRVRRPRPAIGLKTRELTPAGKRVGSVHVIGNAAPAGATVRVTLEVDRPVVRGKIQKISANDPAWPPKVLANHAIANDKVVARAEVTAGPQGSFTLDLPHPGIGGTYLVKAHATGEKELLTGGLRIRLSDAEKAAPAEKSTPRR